MKRTAVIMAGGSGERFWPLSRKKRPKQLLPLVSEKTMIEESINRIAPLIPPEDVFIITSETLLESIRHALPQVPSENIVAEPHKRNTAPCLALSAAFITSRYSGRYAPDEISMAVLTADQSISPNEGFLKTVETALKYVEKKKVLCTIGITPNRAETGYGYVEIDGFFDVSSEEVDIKPVRAFHEKPDFETALMYVKVGNYLWNSGMFFWRLDTFIDSIKVHLPEVGDHIDDMIHKYEGKTKVALPDALNIISDTFSAFPNTSIDYGLMEKAKNVVVAKAQFEWDDIGSWDSMHRVRKADENNNVVEGKNVLVDVNDSVIINAGKDNKMIVAGIGLRGMVVVVTDDAVLVCPKDKVQDVKKSVDMIKKQNGKKWL